jgi:hypothetical protein
MGWGGLERGPSSGAVRQRQTGPRLLTAAPHQDLSFWAFKCGLHIALPAHFARVVHTTKKVPVTHPHTEDKLRQAWVVLWWGTTREGQVMTLLLLDRPCEAGRCAGGAGSGERAAKGEGSSEGQGILFAQEAAASSPTTHPQPPQHHTATTITVQSRGREKREGVSQEGGNGWAAVDIGGCSPERPPAVPAAACLHSTSRAARSRECVSRAGEGGPWIHGAATKATNVERVGEDVLSRPLLRHVDYI